MAWLTSGKRDCEATFSAAEWAQHLIRYFDGRFLSTSHGQRVIWAIFNTVMREETRKVGSLVYTRGGQDVLSKAELEGLLDSRQDLTRSLMTMAADVKTTLAHWKRQANHLEWIVRQMSWIPPWCADDGLDDVNLFDSPRRRNRLRRQQTEELVDPEETQARTEVPERTALQEDFEDEDFENPLR